VPSRDRAARPLAVACGVASTVAPPHGDRAPDHLADAPVVAPPPSPGPFAARPVLLLAAAQLALQAATTSAYGLHAGELVQLAQARRPAWGYIDAMPMVPFLMRVSSAAFGESPAALHVFSIAAGLAHIVLAALIAREVGGGRWAQSTAALLVALGPLFLGSARFLGPFTLDVFFVALASLVVLRLVRTGDPRWWLVLGVVLGLGLYNKLTIVVWAFSVFVSLATSSHRRLLRSGWLVAGAAAAAAVFSPSLAWLFAHRAEYQEFLSHSDTSARALVVFCLIPLMAATPVGAVFAARALGAWRDPELGPRFGFLARSSALAIGIYLVGGAGAQAVPLLLPLVALGAVAVEARSGARPRRALVVAFTVVGLLMVPMTTSILPARTTLSSGVGAVFNLNFSIGYHDVARDIARAHHALPADVRDRTIILTYTNNEAAVVEHWRHELRVPQPISGENNYGFWGYGSSDDEAPVLVVGFERAEADRHFRGCRQVATIGANGRPMDPNEEGRLILWCERARRPWAETWPLIRRFARI
jgi:hypothetical protein